MDGGSAYQFRELKQKLHTTINTLSRIRGLWPTATLEHTDHKLQVVDCSKREPYMYWGLLVMCAAHQLHRKKNGLGISP